MSAIRFAVFLGLSALPAMIPGPAFAQGPEQVLINAPFVTTADEVVDAMLELAGVKSSDVVYDLGCGDGRIVIAAAKKYGAHGVGIDINPDRIKEARENARASGVEHLVRFEEKDLFKSDFHEATVVTLYLLMDLNLRLRPKLLQDLKPGSRIVSHDFAMGDWKPDKVKEIAGARLLLWTIPDKPQPQTK
jgi:SAM-dependent methyltransferase